MSYLKEVKELKKEVIKLLGENWKLSKTIMDHTRYENEPSVILVYKYQHEYDKKPSVILKLDIDELGLTKVFNREENKKKKLIFSAYDIRTVDKVKIIKDILGI